MGYVGNTPALNYTTFAVQHFTTSATTGYTLDNAVTNENGIALFINNVRQEPGSSYAYTASGTSLTLSAATTTSDTMYCVFIGKAVQTVNPGAGSVGTSQLATDAVTQVKMADDSVGTAEILDNNVTLAKLDDGTQGDILYYGASGAPTRLGFGTSGDFLKTQGTGANPAWATVTDNGKILQVVCSVYSTETTSTGTTTTSDIDTGATAQLTTSATDSKVLCIISQSGSITKNSTDTAAAMGVKLFKDLDSAGYSEVDNLINYWGYAVAESGQWRMGTLTYSHLTPTVSSSGTVVDFKTQFNLYNGTGSSCTAHAQSGSAPTTFVLFEVGA